MGSGFRACLTGGGAQAFKPVYLPALPNGFCAGEVQERGMGIIQSAGPRPLPSVPGSGPEGLWTFGFGKKAAG